MVLNAFLALYFKVQLIRLQQKDGFSVLFYLAQDFKLRDYRSFVHISGTFNVFMFKKRANSDEMRKS